MDNTVKYLCRIYFLLLHFVYCFNMMKWNVYKCTGTVYFITSVH